MSNTALGGLVCYEQAGVGLVVSAAEHNYVYSALLARVDALIAALGDAADEVDNYIVDCENYEAPEEMDHLREVAAANRAALATRHVTQPVGSHDLDGEAPLRK